MTTMTTTKTTPDALNAHMASQIRDIDAQIVALQQQRAVLSDSLAYRLPIGKTTFDSGSVTVSPVNTYDGDAFMALLRPGQQQRVTSRTLDRAKARAAYPALWESVKSTSGRKVSVSK